MGRNLVFVLIVELAILTSSVGRAFNPRLNRRAGVSSVCYIEAKGYEYIDYKGRTKLVFARQRKSNYPFHGPGSGLQYSLFSFCTVAFFVLF